MKGTPAGQVYGPESGQDTDPFPIARARVHPAAAAAATTPRECLPRRGVCEQMADTGLFVPAATGPPPLLLSIHIA